MNQAYWSQLKEWGWEGESNTHTPAGGHDNVWHWALSFPYSHRHTKALQLLLDHAPRPRLQNQEHPLLLIAAFSNTGVIPELIEAGEDVNEKDGAGNSILLLGLNRSDSHCGLEELMPFNPDLSPNQFNETPLLFAGRQTHFALFQIILERSPDELVNLPDVNGRTPLVEAYADNLRSSRFAKMKRLLERGANPNVWSPWFHQASLLLHAMRNQADDIVELLLEFGADPWTVCTGNPKSYPLSHQLGLLRNIELERIQNPIWNPIHEDRFEKLNHLLKEWIIDGERRLLHEKLPLTQELPLKPSLRL